MLLASSGWGFFREHFAVAEKALKNWPFSQCLTCPFCTAKRTIRKEGISIVQTFTNNLFQINADCSEIGLLFDTAKYMLF